MNKKAHPPAQLRQYSDQMHCYHCGKQWDVNDPEPPECKTGMDWLREIKNKIGDHGVKKSDESGGW